MDPLYEKALELFKGERTVTVSWLQRELDIGFSRAARLVEAMEKEGVVGPAFGAQGRKVLAQQQEEGGEAPLKDTFFEQEGALAFRQGVPIEECPPGTEYYQRQWERGWLEAEAEAKEEVA